MTETATKATRGTTNRNARGSTETRRRRRQWLIKTYRADVDASAMQFKCGDSTCDICHGLIPVALGRGIPACRCYRCGELLTEDMVTADRIKPGCQGGTYRRDNIRPCCGDCNSKTGGSTRSTKKKVA